jgi:TRAP-type uncharacterized transport system substrate-binding protein
LEFKFLGSGVNWAPLCSQLALWLSGYYSVLPEGSLASVTCMEPGRSIFDGPQLIARGDYHVAITTPAFVGRLAAKGLPPFERALPLAAIANFPHDDRMVFAVRRETGIASFEDIRAKKYPLRISTPMRETRHPAVWCAEEVLKAYGFDFDDVERWGGKLLRDRPRMLSGKGAAVTEDFTAIFDEAIMTLRWKRLTEQYDLAFLPVDAGVLAEKERAGWDRGVLAKGLFRGVDADVATFDFSGWLMYCAADLADELAYFTVMAIDEQQEAINRARERPGAGLTSNIDMRRLATGLPIPLHPGAERYYREKGYL